MSLEGVTPTNTESKPIYYDKITNLAISCVTTKELINTFNKNTDLSDVICKNRSEINGEISKAKFENII